MKTPAPDTPEPALPRDACDRLGALRRGDGAASILRIPDPAARHAERRAFVDDLQAVKRLLDRRG